MKRNLPKTLIKEIQSLKREISEELGDYSDLYMIVGPVPNPVGKPYLQLRISRKHLNEYLENKARDTVM
ncbi:MAG: hypothetical protein F7B20_03255 [Aeropyrum sp.]|nr:hypothetical protein [Aeropyrum sp.]